MRVSSRAGRSSVNQPGAYVLWPCFEIYNLSHLGNDEALKRNTGQGPRGSFLLKGLCEDGFHVRGKVLIEGGSAKESKQGRSRYPITDSVSSDSASALCVVLGNSCGGVIKGFRWAGVEDFLNREKWIWCGLHVGGRQLEKKELSARGLQAP